MMVDEELSNFIIWIVVFPHLHYYYDDDDFLASVISVCYKQENLKKMLPGFL